MAIDLQRILESAAKAAVEQGAQAASESRKPKKRRLSTGRAMLLGAGLATAGQVVISRKGRDMLSRVQRQIADSRWVDREPDDEDDRDYEDDEGYEPEPEDLEDEELSAEDEEIDDSSDLDQEPEPPPDEDEDASEDEDGSQEAEPKRPPRPRTRQRRRA